MNTKFLLVAGALLISTCCFAKQIPIFGEWDSRQRTIEKDLPIEASLEEGSNELVLQFHENLGLVYVTVTNSVGEMVYNRAVETQNVSTFIIQLNDAAKEECVLSVTDGRNEVYGEFSNK